MNTAFAYVGCTSIDGHPHITFSSIHNNSPGLCLTFCKRMKMAQSMVGLSRDKCLCLRMLPSRDLHKTGCHLQNSVWVAGDGDKLMSIYEKKDIFGSGGTNDVQCLAFDKYSSSASWNGCRRYNKCLCKAKDGTYIKVKGHSDLPWAEYIKQCFTSNCRPITYEDIQNRTFQLNELAISLTWTRDIQSLVIYKYNELKSKMNINYGYLKRKGEDISLEFSSDENATKRALFETSDVTVSSNDKTTFMSGSQSSSTTSVLESVHTVSSLSPETLTEESPLNVEKQMDQNSDVGVAIGISVSSAMIVVAIVVIIVTLKRRGKIPTKCFRQAESECSAYTSTVIHPGSQNDKNAYEMSLGSPYDQIDDLGLPSERCSDNEGTDNVISGHTYFILEKHTWESDTDDNIENMTKTETSNVYNTLNSNGNKTGSNESGNTYDTTEKVVTKLKAQHHTNVEDATENTYNHTGIRPVKIGKTDDVYGVLNNVEGEYDDVDTRNIKSQFNGGDTYSHIMKKN